MTTEHHNCDTRIGLMFGSFNPPHLGHVETASRLKEKGGLSEVWMMPIPKSPYKKDIPQAPFYQKVEMCELLSRSYPWLRVSDACKSFPDTFLGHLQAHKRTVEKIFNERASSEIYLVAGEDFAKKFEKVVASFAYLAMVANSIKNMSVVHMGLLSAYADRVVRVHQVYNHLGVLFDKRWVKSESEGALRSEVSSSTLRRAIASGSQNVPGLPQELLEYIHDKGLFREPV